MAGSWKIRFGGQGSRLRGDLFTDDSLCRHCVFTDQILDLNKIKYLILFDKNWSNEDHNLGVVFSTQISAAW
jgi:hypothetical protein